MCRRAQPLDHGPDYRQHDRASGAGEIKLLAQADGADPEVLELFQARTRWDRDRPKRSKPATKTAST